MIPEGSDNLKQLWEGLKHLLRSLALFRSSSIAFRGLWNFENGVRGL